MRKIREMIQSTLAGDATLRAIMGQTATPYGVYLFHLPEKLDFSTGLKSYITHYEEVNTVDNAKHGNYAIMRESSYMVTVWGKLTGVSAVHGRVRYLLHNRHSVVLPTAECEVHDIRLDWVSPDLYDEDLKIYFKTARYSIKYRDDNL